MMEMEKHNNNESAAEADGYADTLTDNSFATSSGSDSDESNTSLLERNSILFDKFMLPKDLCDNGTIFDEFLSPSLWDSLPPSARQHLTTFLPISPDERSLSTKLVHDLLSHRLDRFGVDQIAVFQHNLAEGNFRTDIAKLRRGLGKSVRKERKMMELQRTARLAQNLVLSREAHLLAELQMNGDSAMSLALHPVHLQYRNRWARHLHGTSELEKCRLIAKKRYLSDIFSVSEAAGVSLSISDEEDCLDAIPVGPVRKQRRMFGTGPNVSNEHSHHPLRHGTVHGNGGVMGSNSKRGISHGNSCGTGANVFDGTSFTTPKLFLVTDDHYQRLLLQYRKRKIEEPDHPELDLDGLKLKDVVSRTQIAAGYRRILPLPKVYLHEAKSENALDACETMKTLKSMKTNRNSFNRDAKTLVHPATTMVKTEEHVPKVETLDDRSLNVKTEKISTALLDMLETKSDLNPLNPTLCKVEDNDTHSTASTLAEDKTDGMFKPSSRSSTQPLPIDLKTETVEEVSEELSMDLLVGNDTHACFLSVVRDLFCSNPDHRSTMEELQIKMDAWSKSSVASRNSWYNEYQSSGEWRSTLQSAVRFLAGDFQHQPEDFVPYIEHKVAINVLQWIGASRDGDCRLVPLCTYWQTRKQEMGTLSSGMRSQIASLIPNTNLPTSVATSGTAAGASSVGASSTGLLSTKCKSKTNVNSKLLLLSSNSSSSSSSSLSSISSMTTIGDGATISAEVPTIALSMGTVCSSQDDDGSVSERSVSPPPPRFPTDWSVRRATDEEVRTFREQEKQRYENPHMAYTYRQHSYDSVVGPVKGIYTQVPGISKARGHSMLVADRPNFVTILTLVRDATARLPNGEGTRADICELLKSSQYISSTATDQILQTIVSGALDRMHTEHDPCVKYDAKRKIWIYLHRNRTEEEFERLHLQYQGFTKHKKSVARKPVKCLKDAVTPASRVVKSVSLESVVLSDNHDSVTMSHELSIGELSGSTTHVRNALELTDGTGSAANPALSVTSSVAATPPTKPATSLLKKHSTPLQSNALLLASDRKMDDATCSGNNPTNKLLSGVSIQQDQSKQSVFALKQQSPLLSSDTAKESAMKMATKASGAVTLITSTGSSVKTIKIPKSSISIANKPGPAFSTGNMSANLVENSTPTDNAAPSYITIPQKNVLVSAFVSTAKSTPGTSKIVSTMSCSNTKLLADVLRKVPSMPIVVQSSTSTASLHASSTLVSSSMEAEKKLQPDGSMLAIRQVTNSPGTIIASTASTPSSAINEQPSSSQMLLQTKGLQLPLASATSTAGGIIIHTGTKAFTTMVGVGAPSAKPIFTTSTGSSHLKALPASASILSHGSPLPVAGATSSTVPQRVVVSTAAAYTPANSGLLAGVALKPSGVVTSIGGTKPTTTIIPTSSTHRVIRPSANLISTITLAKGQQSVLTPAQQKQILQNLLCQQQKQQQHQQQGLATKKILPTGIAATSSISTDPASVSRIVDTNQPGNGASATLLQDNQLSTGTVSTFKLQHHPNANQAIKTLSPQIVKITPARACGVTTSSALASNPVSSTTASSITAQGQPGMKMMKLHQSGILTSTGTHTMLTSGAMGTSNIVAVSTQSTPTATMRVLKTATGTTTVIKTGRPGTPHAQSSPNAPSTQHAVAKLRKDTSPSLVSKVSVTPNVSTGQLIPLESLLHKQGITTTTTSSAGGVGSTFLKISGTSKTGQPQFLQFTTNTSNATSTQAAANVSSMNAGSSGAQQYTLLSQNARNIISVTPSTAGTANRAGNLPVTIVSSVASETNDASKAAASTHGSPGVTLNSIGSPSTTSAGSSATILSHVTAAGKLQQANKIKLFASSKSINSHATVGAGASQQHGAILGPKTAMGATVVGGTGGEFLNAKIIGVRNVTAAKMKGASSLSLMNAANLNIAHIGGKPVIIANNSTLSGNPSVTVSTAGFSTNNNPNTASNTVGSGSGMVLTGNTTYSNVLQVEQGAKGKTIMTASSTTGGDNSAGGSGSNSLVTSQAGHTQTQTLMLGNQLVKVQTIQAATSGKLAQKRHTVLSDSSSVPRADTNSKPNTIINTASGCTVVQQQLQRHLTSGNVASDTTNATKSIVAAAMTKSIVKIQPGSSGANSNTAKILEVTHPKGQPQPQRVVLATSSGQLLTQPIILPSGFQSAGPINIKRLKVIPASKQCKK